MGKNALEVFDIYIVRTVKRREASGIARKDCKTCFFCIVVDFVVGVFEARVNVRSGDGFGKFIPSFDDVEVEIGDVVVLRWG